MQDCTQHGAVVADIKNIKDDVAQAERGIANLCDFFSIADKTLTKHDEWIKQCNARIEKTERLTEAVVGVTAEIKISNQNQEKILEAVTKNQSEHDKRLKTIEDQPAVNALAVQRRIKERVFDITITFIVTGALAYIAVLSKLVR